MNNETIPVKLENGSTAQVVVLNKNLNSIQIVLGEGVHSMKCELTPTRNGLAYVGSIKGREIIYERSKAEVQADLDRINPARRKSRPR